MSSVPPGTIPTLQWLHLVANVLLDEENKLRDENFEEMCLLGNAHRASRLVPARCKRCCWELPQVLKSVVEFCERSQKPLVRERDCHWFQWDKGTTQFSECVIERWHFYGCLLRLQSPDNRYRLQSPDFMRYLPAGFQR